MNVTIDGRRIEVESGTTILEAASALGIRIPTLCYIEDLEPATSCFLCVVQVEGMKNLSPSCGLPVSEGMVVTTDSEDLRSARKMALELLLSDHAGDCVAPCSMECPADLDVSGFLHAIADGQPGESMRIINDRLALPGALGRICPRLCEQTCRRAQLDDGLAIGALHRHAADRDLELENPYVPPRAPSSGKSVGIVGAGPAGIAAAFYLLQKGHDCTLYDEHPEPGGMLRYGIPEYRLPRDDLAAEIGITKKLGGRFEMNRRWGDAFSLADLREAHDAVFLAIGAKLGRKLGCSGDELGMSGVDFLERVARDNPPRIGDRIVVVGGGNTAMDASRSALRVANQELNEKRSSAGEAGANRKASVKVLYRRTRREMPCLLEEVEQGEAEGIEIDYLVLPVRLERIDKETLRLTVQDMELGEPDDSGRRRPVPIEGSEYSLEATTVIAAIGQRVDCSLAESEGLEVTDWGILTNPQTSATSLDGIFAGGDAVLGPDLAVRAVAAGRHAAVSVDQFLTGRPVLGPVGKANSTLQPIDDRELAAMYREIEKSARVKTAHLGIERRVSTFEEVDPGLSDMAARGEAHRCMSCSCRKERDCVLRGFGSEYRADPDRFRGQRRRFDQELSHPEIIYEPGKCIACDACVRIAAEEETVGVTIVGRGFDVAMAVPFDLPLADGLKKVARRCAAACPTGALSLRSHRACDLTCMIGERAS